MSEQIELSNITDGTPISYGVVQPGKEDINGVKFIRGGDISNGRILSNQLRTISNDVSNKYKRTLLKGNEVLISLVGNPGEVSVTTKEFIGSNIARQVGLIRPNNLFNPYFIQYYLMSPKGRNQLISFSLGSVQKVINLKDLKKVKIPKLSIDEQNKIVYILKTLDEKTQLNTQINQTVEQIAQALFKSWFVDFDPVRAKVQALSDGLSFEQAELAAMQAISGKTPEELTALSQTQPDRYEELAETAKAFPCEIVEIDGVELPKGWELSTIGEEVETVGGATPSTKEESFWNNGKIAWTTPKDLSFATNPVLINTERKITELGLKKISSGLLPIGTVLLSSRAPVGYLALTKIPVAINQGYIAIKCNKTLSNFYMLQWCKENLEEIKSRASGTTFLEISKTTFRGISVIVPEKNILIMFNKQCESIYEMVTNHTK